jgi:hypothetical protein
MKNPFKRKQTKSSPQGGKRGCLCKDGTYNAKCCDGTLPAQGIGNVNTPDEGIVNNIIVTRQIN